MAITKIHAIKVRLGDAINYIENPDKTDGQELISGYNTAPQTAVLDFSITAAMARKARNTSAKKQGNLAYHLIQSFSPDDAVTPERAHELGRKLAMEFTDGKFEFVVATHINKDSIHMLNQAQGDREILAKQLNISQQQMTYVTHSDAGEGLIFYGNVILPFIDRFPQDTELYRVMTTKPGEVSA